MLRGCSEDLPTSRRRRLWASSENVISLFCHELVWRSLEETEIFCDLLSRVGLFEIKREGFFEKLTRLEHNDCPRTPVMIEAGVL